MNRVAQHLSTRDSRTASCSYTVNSGRQSSGQHRRHWSGLQTTSAALLQQEGHGAGRRNVKGCQGLPRRHRTKILLTATQSTAETAVVLQRRGRRLPLYVKRINRGLRDAFRKAEQEVAKAPEPLDQVARILAFFDDVAGCLETAEGPLHCGNIATALHVLAALKHRRGSRANSRSWSACRLLELVVALVAQARPRLANFSAAQLSSTMWAMAKLQYHPGGGWMDEMAAAAARRVSRFSGPQITLLLWSCAFLGYYPDQLMVKSAVGQAALHLEDLTPSHLSKLAWAMAQMHHPVSLVFWERLVAAAVPAIPAFTQKELSDLLWALQESHYTPSPQLGQAILEHQWGLDTYPSADAPFFP